MNNIRIILILLVLCIFSTYALAQSKGENPYQKIEKTELLEKKESVKDESKKNVPENRNQVRPVTNSNTEVELKVVQVHKEEVSNLNKNSKKANLSPISKPKKIIYPAVPLKDQITTIEKDIINLEQSDDSEKQAKLEKLGKLLDKKKKLLDNK